MLVLYAALLTPALAGDVLWYTGNDGYAEALFTFANNINTTEGGSHLSGFRAGLTRTLTCASEGDVGQVEVRVEITHTYVGDLSVSLVSPAGTTVVLHDRAGGSEDNLIKTFTATQVPALAALAGQPARGTWTLKVADHAGQDVGKLARWSLRIG